MSTMLFWSAVDDLYYDYNDQDEFFLVIFCLAPRGEIWPPGLYKGGPPGEKLTPRDEVDP
jgi:hypothetical protein